MRYSKQRELVMQTVQQLCDHPTAEEIYDKAAQECPNLSLGTVYRNLNSAGCPFPARQTALTTPCRGTAICTAPSAAASPMQRWTENR